MIEPSSPPDARLAEVAGLLRVAEAQARDADRGIVRLDPADLAALGARTGELLLISGKRTTVAKALPLFVPDRGQGIIQLDGVTRDNARAILGERVSVRPLAGETAKRLVLQPVGGNANLSGEDARYLAHLLEGHAVVPGDRVRVALFGPRPQDFQVLEAQPAGPVLIDAQTGIRIAGNRAADGRPAITYEDIGGLAQEVRRIREMIELPLRYPVLFERLGIDPPKGVLLHGPPGTGKTLIARAVAYETAAHFYHINGPEIINKFYGQSEANLRSVFEEASKTTPSVIFIDEIDAIAPKRTDVTGDVEKRVVAQLLGMMDGLQARGQVIVIGATNIPDALDPALRRPGRFDRELTIAVPDRPGRHEILQIHTRGMPLAADVDLERLAALTHGFVGADLAALCREAAMVALRGLLPAIDFGLATVPYDQLAALEVRQADFLDALREVSPSALREVFTETPDVTWDDIGGLEEAKAALIEAVEWPLRYGDLFDRLNAAPPRGILLDGPPGTGKTLLARAVAHESEANFIAIKGPELLSKWVGESERGIREVFKKARAAAPCLAGDTTVTLSGGEQITIQEMFEREMVGVCVPSLTKDLQIEEATVLAITRKPCPDLYRIVTATSEIRATGNHLFPILKPEGLVWMRADQLCAGDYVAVPRQIKTSPQPKPFYDLLPKGTLVHFPDDRRGERHQRLADLPDIVSRQADVVSLSIGPGGFASSYLTRVPTHITEEVAYLVGLLASDGSFGAPESRRIAFYNTELALHELVARITAEQFGYEPKRYIQAPPAGKAHHREQYVTHINNRLLCIALRRFAAHLLELPTPLIAAWLRGILDGDGSVRADPMTPQIILSAFKTRENRVIRDALLRLGIVVSRSPRAARGIDGNIVITGQANLRTFLRLVGSSHPAKRAKIETLAHIVEDSGATASRLDSIPVSGLLRDARLSLGMGQRSFVRGDYVSTYERGQVVPPRARVQTIVAEMEQWCGERGSETTDELRLLRNLAHADVLWSRIEGIERTAPETYVYDLCLDRNHSFVANNILTHNCVLFFDEIDALVPSRGGEFASEVGERLVGQLLTEMDGLEELQGVVVLGATNRADLLDPALLRPGRFDLTITLPLPDFATREAIVAVHLRDRPLANDVDYRLLARETEGRSGADIGGLCRQATVLAIREAIVAGQTADEDDLRVALRHFAEAAGQLGYDDFDDAPYAPPRQEAPRRSWWG